METQQQELVKNYITGFAKRIISMGFGYKEAEKLNGLCEYNEMEHSQEELFQELINEDMSGEGGAGKVHFLMMEAETGNADTFFNEFKKLQQLLEIKGLNLTMKELNQLVEIEFEKQYREDFNKKVVLANPRSEKGLIVKYLNAYGEKYPWYFDFFIEEMDKLNGEKLDYTQAAIKIQDFQNSGELDTFEEELLNGKGPTLNMEEIFSADGLKFESFLKELFGKMGYVVEITKSSGDQGADLIVQKFNEKIAVQAKRYNNKVSNSAIQEVVASMKYYGASKGMVITTNDFTFSAKELADANRVELINGDRLREIINQYY